MRPGDREHRQAGRMIRPLDEGQARDDLRRIVALECAPPGADARRRRDEPEVALRPADGCDHVGGASVRDERHREAEVEARRVAHRRLADRKIAVHAERRLHIGEGRDDHPPDALGGIEWQDAVVALDQAPHHLGLARRTEGGARLGDAFDLDQPGNDLAPLHEQPVHLAIDAVDIGAQLGKRGQIGGLRHG